MPAQLSPQRWREIEPLLDGALDLDEAQRDAYLRDACAGDMALLRDVRQLLTACAEGDAMLPGPAAATYARMLMAEPPLPPVIGERYRLVRELGRGGMATVYLADDPRHGRQVAVKVLHGHIARTVGVDRFRQEIAIAARLSHPHILPLHDSGEAPHRHDGGPTILYFVAPFIAGESLRDLIAREGTLRVHDAVRLVREVAGALDYAHRSGVVHLDIKPANILLHEGHGVVADFGIARAIARSRESPRAPRRSASPQAVAVYGTPDYMSPEQAAGSVALDGRSDVYSLGCVLYEAVAGRRPFPRELHPRDHDARARRLPPELDPAVVPPSLAVVIRRAMASDPGDRFQTADEMAAALAAAIPIAAAAPTTRRQRIVAAAALALPLAVGAIVVQSRNDATPLDAHRLVVAPFDAPDAAHALWRQGMMDVLSRNLDGAGSLQAVPPSVALRGWRGPGDAARARALGMRTGAGMAIYGALLPAGDSVRASLVLLDTRTGRRIAELTHAELSSRMDRLTDTLTVSLIEALGRTRRMQAARAPLSRTVSLGALKSYLHGEQFYRAAAWDSAASHFAHALEQDSTFAFAYHRLAAARQWQGGELGDSSTYALLLRAGRHRQGLAPRESALVHVDSMRAMAHFAWRRRFQSRGADAAPHERATDALLRTLADATGRFPRDPELWFLRAEAHVEHGSFVHLGEQDDAALARLYDRAIALDSSFAPAYLQAIQLAPHLDDPARLTSYVAGYLGARPVDSRADPRAASIHLLATLLDSLHGAPVDLGALAETTADGPMCEVAALLQRYPDATATSLRLHRMLLTPRRGDPAAEPRCAPTSAAWAMLFRGMLREAHAAAGHRNDFAILLASDMGRLGQVAPSSARSTLRGLLARGIVSPSAFAWWAHDRDTSAITTAIARFEGLAVAAPRTFAAYHRGSARTGRAFRALARGDTAGAIRGLQAVPDSMRSCWHYARLTLAQLLAATRRHAEAQVVLARRWAGSSACGSPVDDILWTLERARNAERTGRPADATRDYRYVATMWSGADAELQPLAQEAVRALARLGDVRFRRANPFPPVGAASAGSRPNRRKSWIADLTSLPRP